MTIAGLLAITMGANTAVFGVVNATLLRPLPYADPERLVLLWESYPPMQLVTMPWSDPDYLDVRAAKSFESAAIFRSRRVVLTGRETRRRCGRPLSRARCSACWGSKPIADGS